MENSKFIGLGAAGNFTGHLEQAGEDRDFVKIQTSEVHQPKAIFPFYVPSEHLDKNEQFLSTYPLSHDIIVFPEKADNLQIEPEVALICDIEYKEGRVIALKPTHFAAYNDCSIRRPDARKICEKKNWGAHSKGISSVQIALDKFEQGGNLDSYHIACFHKRDGKLSEYGVDSPVISYSYFHQKLLAWIIERMNNQPNQDPMNNISELIKKADYPNKAIISIGATCYTDFGKNHFLHIGDTSIVVVYNAKKYSHEQIASMAEKEIFVNDDISPLIQIVR
ncbi:DUF5718 family protein [Glaesserella parasuis]|uniref:DUF5718 family protein n=1 Tax=Glaesserella parasuis TaxID=738 RepID=UPI00243716B2|nr:DUF5718 family protein [Glaesserella parasuis]MDG6280654.1 DUF5718 family protein [Glaesserella parasuis]